MSEVIEAGHVYLAKPPLFGLSRGTGSNRKIDYVYDEVALEQKLNEKINERKAAGVKIDEMLRNLSRQATRRSSD